MGLIILIIIAISIFEYFFLRNKIIVAALELRINKTIYFLGFIFVVLSFFIFSIPLFYQSEQDFEDMLIGMIITGFFFFFIGNYCIFLYRNSKIIILEFGFEIHSIFKKQLVKWDEIKSVKANFFTKELIFEGLKETTKCSLYYNGLNQLLHLVEIKTSINVANITNKIR